MYKLGNRSRERLEGVHEDLIAIVEKAITISSVDFTVLEGVRTITRQQRLVEIGASTTMRSRHLTGHAVDLGAWVDGQVDWSWPLYYKIADAMYEAANELNLVVESGALWKTFPDGAHHQLPWSRYK